MSVARNLRRLLKKKSQGKKALREQRNFFLEPLEPRLLLSGDVQTLAATQLVGDTLLGDFTTLNQAESSLQLVINNQNAAGAIDMGAGDPALPPPGSLIHTATVTPTPLFENEGDSALYTLDLDAGQRLTLALQPQDEDSSLICRIDVYEPGADPASDDPIASASADSLGEAVWIENIPITTSGTYSIVATAEYGTGAYAASYWLNAGFEPETLGGASDNDMISALNLADSSIAVRGEADRLAVIGQVDDGTYDYYSFDLAGGMATTLALTPIDSGTPDGALTLELLDGAGNVLEAGSETTTFTRITNIADSIVGSWYTTDGTEHTVITFFEDGSFLFAQDGTDDEYGTSGIERGTYTWDQETGAFSATVTADTNGEWGFSHPKGAVTIQISSDNDTLTYIDAGEEEGEGPHTATRVTESVASPIVGSWRVVEEDDGLAVVTFLEDGTFMMAEEAGAGDGGQSGTERGTYTWDAATGALSATVIVDTNGEWGLSHPKGAMTAEVDGTTMIGRDTWLNVDEAIAGFVPATSGTYFARVSGTAGTGYSVVITRGADFDLEPNSEPGQGQDISLTNTVLGSLGQTIGGTVDMADYYVVQADEGDILRFITSTPTEPDNNLNPALELFAPDGTSLIINTDGAGDGRNALIEYAVPIGGNGTYRIAVTQQEGATGSGDYVLDTDTALFAEIIPDGSLAYLKNLSGFLYASDTDSYTIALDAGQLLSIGFRPQDSTLRGRVQVFDPNGVLVDSLTSPAAGTGFALQTVPVTQGGTYTIRFSSVSGSGSYTASLVLNSLLGYGPSSSTNQQAELTVTTPFNYMVTIGANTIGQPAGEQEMIGAMITGNPTSVTAVRGEESVTLILHASPAFPNLYLAAVTHTSNDPWTITAERDGQTVIAVTPAINEAEPLPLVTDLQTSGSLLAPTVSWTLPDLSGFDVDHIRVQVHDDVSNTVVFRSGPLASGTTSYVVPKGTLNVGGSYTFCVILEDLENLNVENRSQTYTQTPYLTGDLESSSLSLGTNAAGEEADRLAVSGYMRNSEVLYSFHLDAGQTATLALTDGDYSNFSLTLENSDGTVLAMGSDEWSSVDKSIRQFTATSEGTYYARIRGTWNNPYTLIVTRGADFNQPWWQAQTDVTEAGLILGAVSDGATDSYHLAVVTGDTLTISTTTPFDGTGEPVNLLNPAIEIIDPNGVSTTYDADDADGRNEVITIAGVSTLSGAYTIRVGSADGSSGSYLLSVLGATGEPSTPLYVTNNSIGEGFRTNTLPESITLDFSSGLDLTTLLSPAVLTVSSSDGTVDHEPAIGFEVLDGNTVRFDFAPSAVSQGEYTFEIAEGAFTNLQDEGVSAFSLSFTVDLTPPVVSWTSVAEGEEVPSGYVTIQVEFNEQLGTANLGAEDVVLTNDVTEQEYQVTARHGLKGRYYDLSSLTDDITSMPNFDDFEPASTRVDAVVDSNQFSDYMGFWDKFGVRWTGAIRIAEAGEVTFYTDSDDGSMLYIDGQLVVNNDGIHGGQEVASEPIYLSAGLHTVRLDFYENNGGEGVILSYTPVNGDKQVIPTEILFSTPDEEGSFAFDPSTNTATITYYNLPEGSYTLTLAGHNEGFHDIAGNPLDGNGDGITGGDYQLSFSTIASADQTTLTPLLPVGSLAYKGTISGNLDGQGDRRSNLVNLDGEPNNQLFSLRLTPQQGSDLQVVVDVFDPEGHWVATRWAGPDNSE